VAGDKKNNKVGFFRKNEKAYVAGFLAGVVE